MNIHLEELRVTSRIVLVIDERARLFQVLRDLIILLL